MKSNIKSEIQVNWEEKTISWSHMSSEFFVCLFEFSSVFLKFCSVILVVFDIPLLYSQSVTTFFSYVGVNGTGALHSFSIPVLGILIISIQFHINVLYKNSNEFICVQ